MLPSFLTLLSIISHMLFIYQQHLLISAPCVQKFPSDHFQTSSWQSCLIVCLFGIGDYSNSFCFQCFCTICSVIKFRILSVIPSLSVCFFFRFSSTYLTLTELEPKTNFYKSSPKIHIIWLAHAITSFIHDHFILSGTVHLVFNQYYHHSSTQLYCLLLAIHSITP